MDPVLCQHLQEAYLQWSQQPGTSDGGQLWSHLEWRPDNQVSVTLEMLLAFSQGHFPIKISLLGPSLSIDNSFGAHELALPFLCILSPLKFTLLTSHLSLSFFSPPPDF